MEQMYGIYQYSLVIAIIFWVLILYKTVDYIVYKMLKED